ncbi:MAG TPA: hypothetical protein VNE58_10765 [Casimicrobiaceae bacterium]|nr:hypothetical protein [Casimicrobiaceae bacterium]
MTATAALIAAAVASNAAAHSPAIPPQRLVQLDAYDRASGSTLPVYEKDGRHYIVGQPGHEYALRIRNCTGRRVLAVTSVDGVNVISGDTATPSQSGYVLEPWGSVEITGWRKSFSRAAAFFFTEHASSYAARTGRPFDVGVIGVAAFAERSVPPARISEPTMRSRRDAPEAEAPRAAQAPMPAAPPAEASGSRANERSKLADDARAESQPLAKLGTGHGRIETSHVRQVAFERATEQPAQIVALHYDRRENLVALGVLPAPTEHYAHRQPNPFPGLRFAPDPR